MKLESVDLSTKPKSFTSYLKKLIPSLGKKTPDEIIDLIKNARDMGVNVSEDYLKKVIDHLEELRGNKVKLLKYIADIFLKGSELGIITTSNDLMEKLASIYGSRDEVLIQIVSFEMKADLLSNIKQTWEAAGEDIEVFSKRIKPFLNNFLSRNKSVSDREALRKAIKEATDDAAILSFRNNTWGIKENPQVVTV